MKSFPETHWDGTILIEKDMRRQVVFGDLGIQVAKDGRVWICVNGEALIRFTPKRFPRDK